MSGGPKRIAVLGSSGSIGRSTLDVLRRWPERFRVQALAVCSNWELLREQIVEFGPEVVAVAEPAAARRLRESLGASHAVEIVDGPDAARIVAERDDVDLVVNGLVGSLGLLPTLAALMRGCTVAIANKEPLVVAGELVMDAARRGGGELLPLDSELSAIHQCLRGNPEHCVRRVILTASGGPFRELDAAAIADVTPEDALNHPTWDMGPKITVDSATLMNKGLEILETRWYFDLSYEQIDVVVHPQSLVHSLVEFVDHSVMAQISEPDMRLPIQYALTYPERLPGSVPPLDLVRAGTMTFEAPDPGRFPCLRLAREAGEAGGVAPAVLNAANEVAVDAFLRREIRFGEIPIVIEECLNQYVGSHESTLSNFQYADGFTRKAARRAIEARAGRTQTTGHAT